MAEPIESVYVELWGQTAGAIAWLPDRDYGVFEFTPEFIASGLDIAPITMPLEQARIPNTTFAFPELSPATFKGLPGLLADALPDKFGNAIIDTWLTQQKRSASAFSPIERLCYTGARGIGALEFRPTQQHGFEQSVPLDIAELVELAQQIIKTREGFQTALNKETATDKQNAAALLDILRVGTSAGGARPKAVIALDKTGNVRSGQVDAPPGFDYWLLKFDGVDDLELGHPKGYGRIEYAYYLMALDCGINMTESRLLEENGRAHFLTKRFDRITTTDNNNSQNKNHKTENGEEIATEKTVTSEKLHLLSLCGIAHMDFNMAGAYSYEQLFAVMRQLQLSKQDAIQQYRRMIFNVLSRNQDDHTKNVAFLMDKTGTWQLSPAYDLTYSHNPAGMWTNQHQMSIAGKRDHFTRQDLIDVGHSISLKKPQEVIDEIAEAIGNWPRYAKEASVPIQRITEIQKQHRRLL